MGYFNPIYIYGVERFLADAKSAGVDGLIVVDLPPEEDDGAVPAGAQGRPRLHPPRDADHRRQAPAGGAREHGRASSITSRSPASRARRPRISARSPTPSSGSSATRPLPVVVGFGVKTGAHAAAIAQGADGVVVGSALDQRRSGARSTRRAARPRERSRPSPSWCGTWPTGVRSVSESARRPEAGLELGYASRLISGRMAEPDNLDPRSACASCGPT